jgi:hypothetical protein
MESQLSRLENPSLKAEYQGGTSATGGDPRRDGDANQNQAQRECRATDSMAHPLL